MALGFSGLKMALMIFAMVLGSASSLPADVFEAAASVVSAGSSLAGTSLSALSAPEFRVTCAIEVENWTRFPLMYPTPRVNFNGAITVTPSAILPGKKEGFSVRKPSRTATGVSGTVSWELQGARRRFVLMWSAPFNFDFHANWMGVGLTRPGLTEVAEGSTWFDIMYYGEPGSTDSTDLSFQRGKFYYVTDPVIYRDEQIEIVGSMTNVHKAMIKVTIRPSNNNWKDLAPSIAAMMPKEPKEEESD